MMQTLTDLRIKSSDGNSCSNAPIALRKHHLVISAIAMLSDKEIAAMNRQDLLDALRIARSPWPRSEEKNVDQMDVSGLRRLLAIVREFFRKEMAQRSILKNWNPRLN